jgi:hypothetical protein
MENWQSTGFMILIQICIGVVIAILGFLMRRSISQIDKRLETGDVKFREICVDIADLKEKRGFDREYFSKEYISKDDFIRDIRALDVKIDGVAIDVKEILRRERRESNASDVQQ